MILSSVVNASVSAIKARAATDPFSPHLDSTQNNILTHCDKFILNKLPSQAERFSYDFLQQSIKVSIIDREAS